MARKSNLSGRFWLFAQKMLGGEVLLENERSLSGGHTRPLIAVKKKIPTVCTLTQGDEKTFGMSARLNESPGEAFTT